MHVLVYVCIVMNVWWTAWYQGLSTIQRDDIEEATSTSTFTLDTSVSTLATSELATCTLFWWEQVPIVQSWRQDSDIPTCRRGNTLLPLTKILPDTVTSIGFYVPSCYRSCTTNLELVSTGQWLTSHSSCGATVFRHKQRQCFAIPRWFAWPVIDRPCVGSSWPVNSTSS